MHTTINLPDELLREARARAALEGRTLDDLITQCVEHWLRRGGVGPVRTPSRVLPFVARAATEEVVPALTPEELARLEGEEDLARFRRAGLR